MTAPAVHIWRLLKWGRVLARHGALRGIERDSNTPTPVRRLARIARFGARVPRKPTYADAFQEIGPAAMLSRAVAGLMDTTVVFSMPGSPAAVRLAMERLILPELGHLVGQAQK